MNKVHFMSVKNDWETPQELFDSLDSEFHFTLDAAASVSNHKLPRYFTEQDNGLLQDWGGNEFSAIPRMGTKKPASGQKSVGEKRKNPTRLSFS